MKVQLVAVSWMYLQSVLQAVAAIRNSDNEVEDIDFFPTRELRADALRFFEGKAGKGSKGHSMSLHGKGEYKLFDKAGKGSKGKLFDKAGKGSKGHSVWVFEAVKAKYNMKERENEK